MLSKSLKSVTLIELLIAIILLAVVILGINNIDIFSRYHFISTDRRVKVQNDASGCLEHITKHASQAIGNEASFGADTVVLISPDCSNTNLLGIFIDTNNNGLKDPSGDDYWIRYALDSSSHKLSYWSQCTNPMSQATCLTEREDLANKVTSFSACRDFSGGNNYLTVSITTCWDPDQAKAACGTSDNPSVNMTTSISLPSVATN